MFEKMTMNLSTDSSGRESTVFPQEEKSAQATLLLSDVNPPIFSQGSLATLTENDKTIFEELKGLIFQGDWEKLLVKLLEFPNFPIDTQDSADDNYTLLHHAAERKSVDCLRILVVDFSAKPNIKTDNGWTPTHLLVISDCRCEHCTKKTLESLQILVDGGAYVDSEDDLAGETPLYYAAKNRLSKPAEFLLNNGANINHWVNGTSVATLLAQFAPDVLKTEFDKRITIQESETKMNRGLRLDFSLLLQDVAIDEGFTVRNTPPSSSSGVRKGIFTAGWSQRQLKHGKMIEKVNKGKMSRKTERYDDRKLHSSSVSPLSTSPALLPSSSTLSSIQSSSSATSTPPKETELLNYLLRADLAAIEAVVNHPFVEAFVHLKWLSVRKVFFFLRTVYLFLISLYTFYVFDTFVNVTCFYNTAASSKLTNGTLSNATTTFSAMEKVKITSRGDNDDETVERAAFGMFFPTAASNGKSGNGSSGWLSFSDYFKAHEMSCEPTTRTTVLAYLFAIFAVCTVLYELYKMFESWYDYFRTPLNYAWWMLALNIGLSLTPGLGVYAHTWHYPHAAFTLVYGWILVLAQIARIPYFGIFVGIFGKVFKDFCWLLFTFSPVLLAFALGFSVMLPQNEFFRYIPLGFFKVFLMMTGDVDFWGVFSGTWTSSTQLKGHIHFPLFLMYSIYILTVTMVLMSLLLGLAVDNIQEVRREAALYRTVRLIQEIGIFESIFHKPALYYCGSNYFRRLFSITSLKVMNGYELITDPEDPSDTTLPSSIKQKLAPYMMRTCCCPNPKSHHPSREGLNKKRLKKRGTDMEMENSVTKKVDKEQFSSSTATMNQATEGFEYTKKKNSIMRRQFFEANNNAANPMTVENEENFSELPKSERQRAHRDLMIYQEVKLLLDDNERLRAKLENLQSKLMRRN